MTLEFEPLLALAQEHTGGNGKNEDGKLERLRTMSMCIMMFLSMASPIHLLSWYFDLLSTLGFMVAVVYTHAEEIKEFGPVVLA